VSPPRAAKPVSEKLTSVGSAQLRASSWHMSDAALCPLSRDVRERDDIRGCGTSAF
jgi:hypothetical protein